MEYFPEEFQEESSEAFLQEGNFKRIFEGMLREILEWILGQGHKKRLEKKNLKEWIEESVEKFSLIYFSQKFQKISSDKISINWMNYFHIRLQVWDLIDFWVKWRKFWEIWEFFLENFVRNIGIYVGIFMTNS